MNYYIGDTHFGQEEAVNFDFRPFSNADEMDRVMIRLWNEKVGPDDDVWILGDFTFEASKEPSWYLEQLNGHKHFIIGNHDEEFLATEGIEKYFDSMDQIAEVHDGEETLILCHFPIACWDKDMEGAIHVYAHIHKRTDAPFQYMAQFDNALNAGCMINNYMPVTLAELKENNAKFKEEVL